MPRVKTATLLAVVLCACDTEPSAIEPIDAGPTDAADARVDPRLDAYIPPPDAAPPKPDPDDGVPPPADPDAAVEATYLPHFEITAEADDLREMLGAVTSDIEIEVSVRVGDQTWHDVEMQLHGGFARRVRKKSYRLTFEDDDEFPVDFFARGLDRDYRRLVLLANWVDPTQLRNALTMDRVRALGGLAPRMHWGTVTINGEHQGLYALSERIDRQYLRREGLDPDGNGYKAFSHNANWRIKPDHMSGYEHKINAGNPTDDLRIMLERITETAETYADFQREIEPWLSLEDFERWILVHTFAMNRDTFTKNYYLFHDLDGPETAFRLISWDADATWGRNWNGEVVEERDLKWFGRDHFSPRLMAVRAYRDRYLQRYLDALDGPLSAEALHARIDTWAALIGDAARADLARWNRDADWDEEVAVLRSFVSSRVGEMRRVIEGIRSTGE